MPGTIDPVVIDFAARGVPETLRAFDTLETRISRLERAGVAESDRGARVRVQNAQKEAQERERAAEKIKRDAEKMESQRAKDAEKFTRQIAATEKREREQSAREFERLEEYKLRIRRKYFEEEGRLATRAAAAEARARQDMARTLSTTATRSVGNMVGRGLAFAGMTFGIGGGFALADATRREMESQRTAAMMVNLATAGNDNVVPQGANVANILGQTGQLARQLGIDKNTLATGALTYMRNARNADFPGAMANIGFFAKMSQVTGTDINDIATAAGTLQSQNQGLTPAGMQQLLLNTYAQAGKGSMSLVDAAKQFGILGATRAYYKGDVAANQQTLIGLGQIAKTAGDTGEAGTFVKDIATEAGNAQRRFRKMTGKNLLNIDKTTGQLDSPEQVVEQVLRSTKGNINLIGELFGQRGSRLFGELASTYRTASTAAGGGAAGVDAGVAAAMANVRQVTGASMTIQDLEKQHAQTMDTPAQRMQVAMTQISETLQTALAPQLEHFAKETLPALMPKFEAIITEAGKLAGWFADNPLKGIGLVVTAAVAKDVAAAGIGMAIRGILSGVIQGALGAGAPGVAMPAATSAVKAIAATVAPTVARASPVIGAVAGLAVPAALAGAMVQQEIAHPGRAASNFTNAVPGLSDTIHGSNAPPPWLADLGKTIGDAVSKAFGSAPTKPPTDISHDPARSQPLPDRADPTHH